MAYGDYNGPDKPNKGQEGGACNRQSCQAEPANWYNHGSHDWYCDDCREAIQFDAHNHLHWTFNWKPDCGHDQFETRQQMDERTIAQEAAKQGLLDPQHMRDMTEHYIEHYHTPNPSEFRMEKRERQAPRPRDQYKNRKRF